MARISRTKGITLFVVTALLIIVLLPFTPLGVGATFHYACSSTTVGSETLWTPWLIVASPYASTAYGNASGINSTGAPATVGPIVATGGQVVGVFALDDWAIQRSVRTLVAGPGVNHDCPDYSAMVSHASVPVNATSYLLTVDLLGTNNRSSLGVPTSISALGFSSVQFGGDYLNLSFRDTCSGVAGGTVVTPHVENVGVPFAIAGGTAVATARVGTSASYSFEFPAGQLWWTWAAPFGDWVFKAGSCPPLA